MSSQPEQSPARRWAMPVAVLTVAALLIALIFALNRDPGTGQEAPAPAAGSGTTAPADGSSDGAAPTAVEGPVQPDLTDIERRDEGDLLAAGPVDAPVALVVFSDYQCPFCARWSEETLPQMMERAEAGDLRIEWRDVNVFGDASVRASKAAYAAAQQGAFWDYHDALYPGGETRSEGELTEEALVALAGKLGLDTEQFSADLGSEQTQQEVDRNATLGLDLGAYSTPAFILGGEPIVGAQPSQVFLDAFDAALARAR